MTGMLPAGPDPTLTVVWAGLIALAVFMYVLMDGFDLGVGILYRLVPRADRPILMASVGPVWDGNETWLVLGGGGLMAAFPLAYATLLPAFYLPILIMLIALIFRGVSFEFRAKSHTGELVGWDWGFALGSLVAAFAQGLVLGSFVQGVHVVDGQFAGTGWEWLSPFSLLTGVALVAGYALLGATWLVLKTAGGLQDWARRTSLRLAAAVVVFMAAVSLAMPFLDPRIGLLWFSWPNILYLSPVPILVGLATLALFGSIARRLELAPFLLALFLFALGYLGLAISLFPRIVPPAIDIWQAAASASSQVFMLVGFVVLLPVVLCYTGFNYWTFRGKADASHSYH